MAEKTSFKVADLAAAAKTGDLPRLSAILADNPHLAQVDMAPDNEHRALHYVVLGRHPEAVRLLLQAGADPRQGIHPHREATSPFTLAEERGYDEIVAILRAAEATAKDRSRNPGDTPQEAPWGHTAPGGSSDHPPGSPPTGSRLAGSLAPKARLESEVAAGNGEAVRLLAKEHPELFRPLPGFPHQSGLLTLAVQRQNLDMLRLLLDLGLDPDDRHRLHEYEEETYSWGEPLWIAAGEAQQDAARLLLERGADPNGRVYAGGTPIHRALNNRDTRMQSLLLSYGAFLDPETAALEGQTFAAAMALHLQPELADALLGPAACGGDPDLVGLCLRRVKWEKDDPRWAKVMDEAMSLWACHPHRKFPDFDRSRYPFILEQVLKHGANPNVTPRFGYRPLHRLAATGEVWGHVVLREEERLVFGRLLLDHGADPNPLDDILLSSPLGWAVRWGRTGLVRLLLERGADPNAGGAPWAKPLAWAEKKGHAEIAGLLREHGAV